MGVEKKIKKKKKKIIPSQDGIIFIPSQDGTFHSSHPRMGGLN
jgi:hypothetical protein